MGKIIRNGIEYSSGGGGGGSSWIESVPEMHRNIFRGNNLGSEVTAAQLSAIQNGTFSNLYVGDYWAIPITINGTEKSVNWRIADMDYWLGTGNTSIVTDHHLVIVPDEFLYECIYDSSSSSGIVYTSSQLYSSDLPIVRTAILDIFPNMVLAHDDIFLNSSTTQAWVTSTIDLMSEVMVMGYDNYATLSKNINTRDVIDKSQLSLFRLAPKYMAPAYYWWLRDSTNSGLQSAFARMMPKGCSSYGQATWGPCGIRPYFLIGVSNEE